MLYSILKVLTKIALKVFFASLTVRGREHIPSARPLLVVANHPNTFMDALLIGAILKRPLYFLARGNLFSSPFMEALLSRLNLIPLHRRSDDPGRTGRNASIFRKCYDYLKQGRALLIFPEGVSVGARRLQPMQNGAARIALGAESEYDFTLDCAILPVGLNYSDPATFRSEVMVEIGPAIDVRSYRAGYEQSNKPAITALTEHIRRSLQELVVDAESDYFDELAADIEKLYKTELRLRTGTQSENKYENFVLSRGIVDAVKFFAERDSARVEHSHRKIRAYLRKLERLNLDAEQVGESSIRRNLARDGLLTAVYGLLGLPLYLFGLLNNYLPYRIPGRLSSRISSAGEYHGPTKMTIGILSFGIFYTLQISALVYYSTAWFWPVVYALLLPLSGFFALYYQEWLRSIRRSMAFMVLFYQRGELVARLLQERREIISLLEEAADEYFAALHSNNPGKEALS